MRIAPSAAFLLVACSATCVRAESSSDHALAQRFDAKIRPLVQTYCTDCHSGAKPKGDLDLTQYKDVASVVDDFSEWSVAMEKIASHDMPSDKAKKFPTDAERDELTGWICDLRVAEAHKNAGDPGIVLARRLNNSEYDYTIRDFTGVDLQPAREFPVDPANPMGFDNTGESLAMSPTLLKKYLQAARFVADCLVLKPQGIAFAPHPMLVETDRDKYCVDEIVAFYHRQPTDYADYFYAAWRYEHRRALGEPGATLDRVAAETKVSPRYLATVWAILGDGRDRVGPVAKLQARWRALPAPRVAARGRAPDAAPMFATNDAVVRQACVDLRDWVVVLRAKLEPRFPNITGVAGIAPTAEPFLMWKNREYATHRRTFDPEALQIDGKAKPMHAVMAKRNTTVAAADAVEGDAMPDSRPKRGSGDPDLDVPARDRERYVAAFTRFCDVFPDAFFVQERGRNYLDKTKDKGRLLSAGFHNVMGYFRDDAPLYDLVLDQRGRDELDALWNDMDFVAATTRRTYVQFCLNESAEARTIAQRANETDFTKEPLIQATMAAYVTKAEASHNPSALQAVEAHFRSVNATLRAMEKAHAEAEPRQLDAALAFAARAYRRPLSDAERADLIAFYRSARTRDGLSHEDAMRDLVTAILMSPDFCYRLDLSSGVGKVVARPGGPRVQSLSDYALASRLSYFLWSSGPDDELLALAAAGRLHDPAVIAAQARRLLADPRSRALAVEFGGNWLDFRRLEELNTVDRERFPTFTNELREAMFEEPVRYLEDVFAHDRSVLDMIYGRDTFVNAPLARHYGMPVPAGDAWAHVPDADRYGRGGLLPMAAFLTKNAPGLRTSPVKRGYWVVKRVLGEFIPPPPAVVPELPRDESKTELPLRDVLARHRRDKSCAACHSRFDSLGLVFEGYGPVGELRTVDLAGRPIDAHATFPHDVASGDGLVGLRDYIRGYRQNDFVDNLCRKLLGYALNRSLMLSDDPTVDDMRARLAANGYRFHVLVDAIVTSPQFLNRRVGVAANDLADAGN